MKFHNYFAEDNLPPIVQHVTSFDFNEQEAVHLLIEYLANNPTNVEARYALAKITWIDDPAFALSQILLARSVSEHDCRLMMVEAECLNYLERRTEAKNVIALLWKEYAKVPEEIRLSESALRYARDFAIAYWNILTDIGEYDNALRVARMEIEGPGIGDPYADKRSPPGIGHIYVFNSLMALERYSEVEFMDGASPYMRRSNIFMSACYCRDEKKFSSAITLFRRCLTLCSWRRERDWYQLYIETLILAGEVDEAALLCRYYAEPKRTPSMLIRAYLGILEMVALERSSHVADAESRIAMLRISIDPRNLTKAARKYHHTVELRSRIDSALKKYSAIE